MLRWVARSVRSKLLAVVIVTTSAALAVAASALIVYDVRTYEETRIADLTTLADVLGTASGPALAFNDAREANDNLALLRVRPTIIAGALYDATGALYAAYEPERLGEVELPAGEHHVIKGDRLTLFKPVFEKGERVGTLYLVARYAVGQRLLASGVIVGVVVLLSLTLAIVVSTWLGRTLSTPIQQIATAARRVMEHQDYSVRVEKTTQDEIGYLVDTFNAMLDEVGRRSAALEDADRRKDQFLAVLSHELRNPLNPILNAVAVLQLDTADKAKVQWARDVIERQARQLARLLDDLMDVARITRNRIELRVQVVEIRTIVEMAAEATRSQFESNRQSLELSLPEEAIHLEADPARMAQVLGNILNNAAKYTGAGGAIRLEVLKRDGKVVVTVKDDGVGIAREDLSRLFEMFTQLADGSDHSAGGLGIGLALVRALVEMHGGHVEARSAGIGKGSEFIVTLPTVPAPVGHALPAAAPQAATERALKILVADDVPDSMQSLGLGLELMGHEVQTAADGPQAVTTAMTFHPDLAILDIGMPGMSGYEVARQIRQAPWGRDVLLVALTGWGQREDIDRAAAAGFDHHMTKPADFARLKRMIDELATRRKRLRQA